jgi:hypothetical protein
MKTATYTGFDGEKFTVEYDENAPCIGCGLPVIEASMGGTALCPWCDCGIYRDGCQHSYRWNEDGKWEAVFPHPEHSENLVEHYDCLHVIEGDINE